MPARLPRAGYSCTSSMLAKRVFSTLYKERREQPIAVKANLTHRCNKTYPCDPFHLVGDHVLLLRSNHHAGSYDAHEADDFLSREAILVDEVGWRSAIGDADPDSLPPIKMPVLPSPALQCTATRILRVSITSSTKRINARTISSDGFDPSSKYMSTWSMPASVKYLRSYLDDQRSSQRPVGASLTVHHSVGRRDPHLARERLSRRT